MFSQKLGRWRELDTKTSHARARAHTSNQSNPEKSCSLNQWEEKHAESGLHEQISLKLSRRRIAAAVRDARVSKSNRPQVQAREALSAAES